MYKLTYEQEVAPTAATRSFFLPTDFSLKTPHFLRKLQESGAGSVLAPHDPHEGFTRLSKGQSRAAKGQANPPTSTPASLNFEITGPSRSDMSIITKRGTSEVLYECSIEEGMWDRGS